MQLFITYSINPDPLPPAVNLSNLGAPYKFYTPVPIGAGGGLPAGWYMLPNLAGWGGGPTSPFPGVEVAVVNLVTRDVGFVNVGTSVYPVS